MKAKIGTRVKYEDRANPYHEGTVTRVFEDRWGTKAEITWDKEYVESGVCKPISIIHTILIDNKEPAPWGGRNSSWGVISY